MSRVTVLSSAMAVVLGALAAPVHAVPVVDLDCTGGINMMDCNVDTIDAGAVLSEAEIGSFPEPATLDASDGENALN